MYFQVSVKCCRCSLSSDVRICRKNVHEGKLARRKRAMIQTLIPLQAITPQPNPVCKGEIQINEAGKAEQGNTYKLSLQMSDTNPSGPSSSTTTSISPSRSERRIVSTGSVADPNQDSAGGKRVWASNEKASDVFANNLLMHIIDDVWPGGITLDWVEGRPAATTLRWNNSYRPIPCIALCFPDSLWSPFLTHGHRAQEGIISIAGEPISARNDGCLQIQISDPSNSSTLWLRQYYVLPLEVLP